jgi:hypothetical protein
VGGLTALNTEDIVERERPIYLAVGQVKPAAFSLRLGPPNSGHIGTLVQLNGKWSPILVSAHDYSIVDGYHRYLAARQLGHTQIYCYLFVGGPEAAFLEALRLNSRQGLALTLKEREQAAGQILRSHLDWSDRRIGELCGLSPTTVGRLRLLLPRPNVQAAQMDSRIGRDDRVRPLDSGALRRRVTQELAARPGASLREIAVLTRCSPETVRAVRRAMGSGDERGVRDGEPGSPLPSPDPRSVPIDPAFASTDEGAAFSAWFAKTDVGEVDWQGHVRHIPLSRVYEVADMAMRRSDAWRDFARALEARVKATGR